MRPIVLIAAVPLLLTACNLDGAGNNTSVSAAPAAVPDEITVNGVVYVRVDRDKIAPAGTTPAPAPTAGLFSDSGASVPPNTGASSGTAADHGE